MIRTFKSGLVRLTGADLSALRLACWVRDKGRCQECLAPVSDDHASCHPLKYDMAHIQSRGAGGSDSLENVRTMCHECHMQEHTKGLKLENKG